MAPFIPPDICPNCGNNYVGNAAFCPACGKPIANQNAPLPSQRFITHGTRNTEQWIIGILLCVALLNFFFPLATLQLPVLGSQNVSGYDIFSKTDEFDKYLSKIPKGASGTDSTTPQQSSPDTGTSDSLPPMPFSVQSLDILPFEIAIALGCALISLFGCFGTFRSAYVKVTSTIGGLSAIIAILHLTIANSDLHSYFQESIKSTFSQSGDNPFAALAQQLGNLVVNSVQIKPGIGLFVLAAALALVAFLSFSRSFAAATEVPTQWFDDIVAGSAYRHQRRRFAAVVLAGVLLLCFIVASLVITKSKHGPTNDEQSIASPEKSAPPSENASPVDKPSPDDSTASNHSLTESITPDQWHQYHALYKTSEARYLRSLFNDYLAGESVTGDGNNQLAEENGRERAYEFSLLDKFDKSYYKSKFILYWFGKALGGGYQISIIFLDKPDRMFNAFVRTYPDGGSVMYGFDSANVTEDQMTKTRALVVAMFKADKEHYAM
jgi:hypothetical protein